MKQSQLSAERARELFTYDPLTGELRWRVGKGNRAEPGKLAGYLRKDGYIEVRADTEIHLAHRPVWLIATGGWPKRLLDHLNGLRADNRLVNLRDVTREVNQQNQREARSDSTVGLLGVSRKRGKYRARIRVQGKEVSLGAYDTPNEAHTAYLSAKRALHAGCTI